MNGFDQSPYAAADIGVQTHGGLVQKQNRRLVHQCPGNHEAALQPAGELFYQAAGPVFHFNITQQLPDSGPSAGGRKAEQPSVDIQVFSNRQFAVQVDVLSHQAALALGRHGVFPDVMPVEAGRTRGKPG